MRNFSDEQFILFFANQHRELFNEIAGDFHEFAYKGEGGKYPEAGDRRSKKHQRYERGTVSRENPARGSRPDVSLSTHRREGRQGAYHYPSMMQEFAGDPTQRGLDKIRKLDRYENPIREKTHDLHKGGVDPESHKPSIEEQQKRLDWSKIPKPGKKDMQEFAVSVMKPPAKNYYGQPRHQGIHDANWDSLSTESTHVKHTQPEWTMKTRRAYATPGIDRHANPSPRKKKARDAAEKGQIELNRKRRGTIYGGGTSKIRQSKYKGDPTWHDAPKSPTKRPRGGPYMSEFYEFGLSRLQRSKRNIGNRESSEKHPGRYEVGGITSGPSEVMRRPNFAHPFLPGHVVEGKDPRNWLQTAYRPGDDRGNEGQRIFRPGDRKPLSRVGHLVAHGKEMDRGAKIPRGTGKVHPYSHGKGSIEGLSEFSDLNEFDCKRRVALGRKMLRFMEGSYA